MPEKIAEAAGLYEGQRVRIRVEDGRIVIGPIYDPIEQAMHGEKIGCIDPEELEEESVSEQEKLAR